MDGFNGEEMSTVRLHERSKKYENNIVCLKWRIRISAVLSKYTYGF